MEISIKIDYGQGYTVFLTPEDARYLYDQLNGLFSQQTTKATHNPGCIVDWPGCECNKKQDVEAVNTTNQDWRDKALENIEKSVASYKATTLIKESPETLRDMMPHDQDCGCNDCYIKGTFRRNQ